LLQICPALSGKRFSAGAMLARTTLAMRLLNGFVPGLKSGLPPSLKFGLTGLGRSVRRRDDDAALGTARLHDARSEVSAALSAEISKRVSVSSIRNRADVALGHAAGLADHRQQPLWIGALLPAEDKVNQTPPSISGPRGSRGAAISRSSLSKALLPSLPAYR
jgi:hypothetical protein